MWAAERKHAHTSYGKKKKTNNNDHLIKRKTKEKKQHIKKCDVYEMNSKLWRVLQFIYFFLRINWFTCTLYLFIYPPLLSRLIYFLAACVFRVSHFSSSCLNVPCYNLFGSNFSWVCNQSHTESDVLSNIGKYFLTSEKC